jgi:hypothetical protein
LAPPGVTVEVHIHLPPILARLISGSESAYSTLSSTTPAGDNSRTAVPELLSDILVSLEVMTA